MRPVSAPIGLVDALKMTLRHCGPRASATASAGIPARVQASASRSTSASGVRPSKGPSVVSPFTSHCTCPGSSSFPAGNVVPRMTRSTCCAIVSSLPRPFWTVATKPSEKACAVAAIAGSVCIAFVATIPKSHARQLGGVARRARMARDVSRARKPQAVAVDRVDVILREVVGPDLASSSSDRFAANSDPTAPVPTTQILTPSSSPPSP